MTRVYFNEINPYKAQWLRNLIAAGHLPRDSVVDTRSIEDVTPADVAEFDRAHFFSGIGGWGLALERAGWPDEAGKVWTCGCPCQPFSAAGKGAGFADKRHLWPAQHWLVEQCKPDVLLGEQVASDDGLMWLDLVQADMEAAGYAGGSTDLCVAGFGGPQIRQRQWLTFERLDNADGTGLEGHSRHGDRAPGRPIAARRDAASSGNSSARPGPVNGFWKAADWLRGREPAGVVWRPVEPGTLPLANGLPDVLELSEAYGETISPIVAQAVAEAYLEHKGWVW